MVGFTFLSLYNGPQVLGCPRNNQIFFSVRTKTNRNSICFGCFSVCFAKPKNIFSVCLCVSDRYRNNRNKQNFVETNRKNLQRTFSIRGSSKSLIFFSVRTETKTQSVSVPSKILKCFLRSNKKDSSKFFRFGGATPEAVSKYCSMHDMPQYFVKYLTAAFRYVPNT